MKFNKLCFWIRFAIIAIMGCGLYLCIFVYPFFTSLTALSSNNPNEILFWTWLVFIWLVSIPCFIVLIIAWRISSTIKNDTLFVKKVSNSVKLCSQILFIDTVGLLIGGVIFTLLRVIDLFIPFVFLLVAAGIAVSIFLAILSHYIYKAAEIKEENEGTI